MARPVLYPSSKAPATKLEPRDGEFAPNQGSFANAQFRTGEVHTS